MAREIREKQVIIYQDDDGDEPFTKWLDGLRDVRGRRRILQRLARLETGNYGDYKSLKDGVYELRMAFGPGYRAYFGEDGDTIVVLLCGGDKSSQTQDIERAKLYWQEYTAHA